MKIYAQNPPSILTNQFNFTNNQFDPDIKLAFQNEDVFYEDISAHFKIFDIPIIGGKRLNKIQQSIVLKQNEIRTPDTYFNNIEYRPFLGIQEFDSFCELNEFVVKPISGSRGIGVKIIDRKQFKEMIENPNNIVPTVYSKELVQQKLCEPDIEDCYVTDQFYDRQMLVQNIIKVKNEFRLICFPTDALIYERKKEEGQFLGNLSHGSTPEMVNVDYINRIDSSLIGKIRNIMKKFSYPWLSVDLYIDEDDKLGVFEFQMEFAYEGFKPKDVRDRMETAIYYSFIK